ncbi:hypothetical protein NA57DRAFT_57142 [Rhizodiscina lignyota]|uniref:UBA domain-containing protein n=1 Tax=Rhizodiscina lignyota TaxID=1504668 RepID=A0A9P4IAF6_9PEZI|nr:hypothetical protein NA57DRAFT_57142 [Rhizodiscina lignyota]
MASQEVVPFSAFSPLDITTSGETPNPRRSLSIFSRRGATPKPQIDRLPSIVSKRTSIRHSIAERRPSKMFKTRRSESKSGSQGTILRAVPEACSDCTGFGARSMSSLELAMATSPNEEILSAIGMPSPDVTTPTSATSPYLTERPQLQQSSQGTTKRSRRHSETKSNVIGMWMNGRTKWVSDATTSATSKESLGETEAISSIQNSETHDPKSRRPRIQVIIPNDRLTGPFPSIPFFQPVASYSSVDAKASAGFVSTQEMHVPAGAIGRTTTIHMSTSALEPHNPQPQRPFANLPVQLKGPELDLPSVAAHLTRPSLSNSTSSDGSNSNTEEEEDDRSNYSARSSMTSVSSDMAANPELLKPNTLHKRTGSQAFSITSPAAAGVYDDASRAGEDSPSVDSIFPVELPGSPVPNDKLSRASSQALPRSWSRKRMSSRRGVKLLTAPREEPATKPNGEPRTPSPTLSDAEKDLETTLTSIEERASPKQECSENETSPLPEVVPELPPLEAKPPTPPPKSARRQSIRPQALRPSVQSRQAEELLRADRELTEQAKLRKNKPSLKNYGLRRINSLSMPDIAEMVRSETPDLARKQQEMAERQISAQQAEEVILHIMEALQSLDDLVNTAALNKGFYRVFKRHEIELLRGVLKNSSAPAWEYMETCRPTEDRVDEDGSPISAIPSDYTPSSYLKFYIESHATLISLKALILAKCQSFLRATTVIALASPDPAISTRVDSALWRIWTFCRIFGSNRSREDDIVGQMDWLRGGQLAHQQTCTSTIVSSDSFYLSSVLLNAPEHFARGNGKKGLGAEDLYDMTELWNCFNWLVQGLEGRTEQARQFGVFDNTEVRGGDIDGEEAMLEEFQSYVLTLGLYPLLTVASALLPSDDNASIEDIAADPTALALAKEHGWSSWTPPPAGGSRSTFLKEPLARLYEERIAAAFAANEDQERQAKSEEMKEVRRLRGQSYAEEIKLRKRSMGAEEPPRPRTGWGNERPMSDWELVISKLASPTSIEAHAEAEPARSLEMVSPEELEKDLTRSATPSTAVSLNSVPQHAYDKYAPSALSGPSAPASSSSSSPHLRPLPPSPLSPTFSHSISSPSSSTSLYNDIHPALRPAVHTRAVSAESQETFYSSARSRASMQHPIQTQLMSLPGADLAAHSAERAIFRIVEMGWTADEARHALRVTDMGDGLRVDRAVELLLRQT